jgi:hypothetical protein
MNKYLSTALYAILKPLIVLMYRNGVAFGEFSHLVKLAYIEVIEKELTESTQKATTSQIAISSGLTRKEVSSLRKELAPHQEKNIDKNRATRVISAWISDSLFCHQNNKANVLNIQGENGSFEQLVNMYSGDMPYKAMMKELLRIGAIETREGNKVALIRAAYIPSDNENEMYDLLGEDVSLLISTIKHNITNKEEKPRYQRKVCYDQIPVENIDEFKEMVAIENQTLLVKLNEWLAQHDMDKQVTKENKESVKVGVGVYYFEIQNKKSKGESYEN